jgi:hypothetical protein
VSPLKRILDRLTGNGEDTPQLLTFGAFGKLPASTEFLHLDVGQGAPLVFQEWWHAAHAGWIRRVEEAKRGRIAPTCLFWAVPEKKHHAIIACCWNSQDGAAPPRSFPFTILSEVDHRHHGSWLERFAFCRHLWPQMQEHFGPLYEGQRNVTELRATSVTVSREQITSVVDDLRVQAQAIRFDDWIGSIARTLPGAEPARLAGFVRTLPAGWREHASKRGLGVRLPLSGGHPVPPQAAAWLHWMQRHLSAEDRDLSALYLPQNGAVGGPALTVLTRPITEHDFQLVTTNGNSYDGVEDLADRAAGERFVAKEQTEDPDRSLWDWAAGG